eukprot:3469653-Pleurochrysis_carterae.AAC.8
MDLPTSAYSLHTPAPIEPGFPTGNQRTGKALISACARAAQPAHPFSPREVSEPLFSRLKHDPRVHETPERRRPRVVSEQQQPFHHDDLARNRPFRAKSWADRANPSPAGGTAQRADRDTARTTARGSPRSLTRSFARGTLTGSFRGGAGLAAV